jgi:hypothetical protein
MSCPDCDEVQHSQITSFFRWKNADVEIRACREHLKEIFEVLRNAQKQEYENEKNEERKRT